MKRIISEHPGGEQVAPTGSSSNRQQLQQAAAPTGSNSIHFMNVLLVSGTEQTREIGIRKAIGAKRKDTGAKRKDILVEAEQPGPLSLHDAVQRSRQGPKIARRQIDDNDEEGSTRKRSSLKSTADEAETASE